MFDSIQWDYDLPDEEHEGLIFQTKDFECMMDLYMVDKKGDLFVKNRSQYDIEFPCTSWVDPKEPMWMRQARTCVIRFYAFIDGADVWSDGWLEYTAHIEKGKVILVYKIEDS